MKNVSLLLAEDREELRDALYQELVAAGYEVRTARNKAEAVVALERLSPAAVITEVSLADGNGFEVARRARQTNFDMPVVFLSGQIGDRSSDRSHFLPREEATQGILNLLQRALSQPTGGSNWQKKRRNEVNRALTG